MWGCDSFCCAAKDDLPAGNYLTGNIYYIYIVLPIIGEIIALYRGGGGGE